MEVVRIPIDDPRWRDFTSSHPDAGPFHLPSWATLIADCYSFEAFALTLRGDDGEVLAGVPAIAVRFPLGGTRWVSLPYSDYCPVLVRPEVPPEDVAGAISDHVRAAGARKLELRADLPVGRDIYPVEAGYRHLLQLPDDPAGLHLHRNFRQHRNQAAKAGVEVTRGTGPADIEAFYRLHTLTRRRHGVPVQPRRLFDLILKRMFANGNGFVATASLDGKAVGACLYLTHNGLMVAKYAASDPSRPEIGANHLIHWTMMSAACLEGYHTYDLGRSDPGADGLRTYKNRMGAEEVPLVYTQIGGREPSHKEGAGVIGGVSQQLIRKSPTWVCRALGEALYRWTA